jgi:hypothetical protein
VDEDEDIYEEEVTDTFTSISNWSSSVDQNDASNRELILRKD